MKEFLVVLLEVVEKEEKFDRKKNLGLDLCRPPNSHIVLTA